MARLAGWPPSATPPAWPPTTGAAGSCSPGTPRTRLPLAGWGLATGIQDAVNLGWKLAAVVTGSAPESLLDTYHTERYPLRAAAAQHARCLAAVPQRGGD
ncbi:FAD-dependent monooxygenase [Streptomyces sp. M10(2022)]